MYVCIFPITYHFSIFNEYRFWREGIQRNKGLLFRSCTEYGMDIDSGKVEMKMEHRNNNLSSYPDDVNERFYLYKFQFRWSLLFILVFLYVIFHSMYMLSWAEPDRMRTKNEWIDWIRAFMWFLFTNSAIAANVNIWGEVKSIARSKLCQFGMSRTRCLMWDYVLCCVYWNGRKYPLNRLFVSRTVHCLWI